MAPSIGVNLRVTGHHSQGGRKYMEDMFSVAYQQTDNGKDLEYAYIGIFDGHGGREAAMFAKEHLLNYIVGKPGFWSDKDEDIVKAIREGFLQTHLAMWGQLEFWPKTVLGFPSNSGTTASIAFIRKGKVYIGHVGDSSIVLGYQDKGSSQWKAKALTKDHKPQNVEEIDRIEKAGGKVVSKFGVPRVVWNRPQIGHKGPVRRSTHIDEIPFLAIARSLGDLWSYNPALDVFVVSPEPDISVVAIDIQSHRCLIFGTDGLWNVLSPDKVVTIVQSIESHNEKHVLPKNPYNMWINPSKTLVDQALTCWSKAGCRADNTSVVTLMLDPHGPPRPEVVLNQRKQQTKEQSVARASSLQTNPNDTRPCHGDRNPDDYDPSGGVAIFTRYLAPPAHPPEEPAPGSSSSQIAGHMCKVNDMLQQDSASKSSATPIPQIQVNEISGIKEEKEGGENEEPALEKHVMVRQKEFSFGSGCLANGFSKMVGFKRRHSSVTKLLGVEGCADIAGTYEPCQKRRTRSEEKRLSASPTDKDLNMSDTENKRVAWPVKWREDTKISGGSQMSAMGPVDFVVDSKTTHRRSILTDSMEIRHRNTRKLRSSTAAATPFRTLRSRNVSILQSVKKSLHRTPLKRSVKENLQPFRWRKRRHSKFSRRGGIIRTRLSRIK